jgi:hypothetical protein
MPSGIGKACNNTRRDRASGQRRMATIVAGVQVLSTGLPAFVADLASPGCRPGS